MFADRGFIMYGATDGRALGELTRAQIRRRDSELANTGAVITLDEPERVSSRRAIAIVGL